MPHKPIFSILIRLAALGGLAVLFGWTAWQNAAPSGVFEAEYHFDAPSPFITPLLPGDRARAITRDESGTFYQGIIGDPTYFRIIPPRRFDRATVEIRFQNEKQPIVELGGLAARNPDTFDLRPLENQILDNLDWPMLDKDELTLYQRTPTYASIDDFFTNLPSRETIATYHAALRSPLKIPGYVPSEQMRIYETSLRGSHTFYAYVKNETLDIGFLIDDMNREAGADPVAVTVFRGTEPVFTVSENDDGVTEATGKSTGRRMMSIAVPGLPEDAYRVEFRTTRDIFIRRIDTRARKFVVANEVFLGDDVGYRDGDHPATLFTSARLLRASTLHADGAQELIVQGEPLRIIESHREYVKKITGTTGTRISSPRGDLILRANGVFAFTPESLFIPDSLRLQWDTDLDAEGINFILAQYEPPRHEGEWKVALAEFDLARLLWEDHVVSFAVSAPGIAALQNEVRISGISVKFVRAPENIRLLFVRWWTRIFQ
ncbi:MAG: hypothetical protein Q8P82_02725 [bacterium]|nr:hypothetical protein [bacterium]